MNSLRRRLPAITVITLALMTLLATPAFAEPIGDAVKSVVFGQANPMLSFIQLTDARGINVWQYELSLDRGNPITATDKWFWAKPMDAAWQFYRDGVLTAIWLLHWILDFGWVAPIGDAAITISDAIHATVSQMGLAGLFLTFAGAVAALYVVRGKIATGVWEFLVAIVIMAGLTTFLANPARMILNPGDGMVYKVRDTSMNLVAAIAQTPDLKGTDQTNAITSDLITTFIRQPLQMVNFGMVIDGTSCEGTYDDVLKSGPHAWDSSIRDKINECSSALGDYASNPSPTGFGTVIFLYPAVLIVLVLAIVIGGAVLLAGLRACYQAVKASVTTIVGVLPGAGRRPFLGTIANFLISLAVFVFSYLFLALFLKVIQLVLGSSGDMPAPQRIFLTDVLLVAGLIIFMVNKKRIQQSAEHLKELLAKRPGGSSGHRQPPTRLNTAAAISAGADVARLARSAARRRAANAAATASAAGGPSGLLGIAFVGLVGGAGGGGGGPAGRAWQTYPHRPSGPGGGAVPTVTGRILTGVAQAGLAHATGGASTAALTAYRALKPRRALPPGPSSQNPSVRRPGGPTPLGPGKNQLALPPGRSTPSGGPGQRPKSRGPVASSSSASQAVVRRPGQPSQTAAPPAWRRSPEVSPRPERSVRLAPERRAAPRPNNSQIYIRRAQGRRGQ